MWGQSRDRHPKPKDTLRRVRSREHDDPGSYLLLSTVSRSSVETPRPEALQIIHSLSCYSLSLGRPLAALCISLSLLFLYYLQMASVFKAVFGCCVGPRQHINVSHNEPPRLISFGQFFFCGAVELNSRVSLFQKKPDETTGLLSGEISQEALPS